MIDFAVIGSGISGATISNKLNKKYSVKVFEKAKGVGGRSSFKRFFGAKRFFRSNKFSFFRKKTLLFLGMELNIELI